MINPTSAPYDDVIGGDRQISVDGSGIARRVVNNGIFSGRDGVTRPVGPRVPVRAGGAGPIGSVGSGDAQGGNQRSEKTTANFA